MGAELSIYFAILFFISSVILLIWGSRYRIAATPQARALLRSIAAFERESHTLLRIEKINPDHVFLRSPVERD